MGQILAKPGAEPNLCSWLIDLCARVLLMSSDWPTLCKPSRINYELHISLQSFLTIPKQRKISSAENR